MHILNINACYQNIKIVAFHAVLISKGWAFNCYVDTAFTDKFANQKGLAYSTLNSLNLNSDSLPFYAKSIWSKDGQTTKEICLY